MLRIWVDHENVMDHPNKASPWNVGVIHPNQPNAITYSQKLRNGPARDLVNKKIAAYQTAMGKI